MLTTLCTHALAILAPAVALFPTATPPRAQGPSLVEVAAMHARFDPSLDSLRAGSVHASAQLEINERTQLAVSEQNNPSLAALRAGFEPSNDEWKWLAIGAGVVLLIILI